MTDLDFHLTADMDKLISVKGLVIRATPIIPDMKEGICEPLDMFLNLKV